MDEEMEREIRRRAKAVLRKRARALRNAMPPGALAERSARIAERLLAHPDVAAARVVALFWPIEGRNEVDLRALDPALRARGVAVAYPSIDMETDPSLMTFRLPASVVAMEERGRGFLDPGPAAPEAHVDVVIVPALQIDAVGHRLGYGAGYYDRALARVRPPALAIGVAFSFQLVADLPSTEHDVPVDVIVTDDRVLDLRV